MPNRGFTSVLLVALAATFCSCSGSSRKQAVMVEFDFVSGTAAVTTNDDGSNTLEQALEDAGKFEVTLRGEADNVIPYELLNSNEIDSAIASTEDHKMEGTANSGWYAHGLVVRGCDDTVTSELLNGTISCSPTLRGMIWLLNNRREDFVIFHRGSDTWTSLHYRLALVLHELGHVFNLHHPELNGTSSGGNVDNDAKYPDVSRDHFRDHAPACAQPGDLGWKWCHVTAEHDQAHGGAACGGGARVTSPQLVGRVELRVEPEKTIYVVGEPIRVNLRLAQPQATAPIPLRPGTGLDPAFGDLTFYLEQPRADPVENKTLGPLRAPLPPTVLADDDPQPANLPGGSALYAFGRDVWYQLRETPIDPRRSFELTASFRGFEDADLVVTSQPVTIGVLDDPSVVVPPALSLFTTSQARKFMLFAGGDHLELGIADMERLVRDHPNTIHATYANLALGVRWSEPFTGARADGSIIQRPADFQKARIHLEAAKNRAGDLPPSYTKLLEAALATTYEELGDAALQGTPPDAAAAEAFYNDAQALLEELSDTCRPSGLPTSFFPHMVSPTAGGARSVFAADLDADGDLDLVSAAHDDDTITWHENDGVVSPKFTSHPVSVSALGAASVTVADVDGDGDADVVGAALNEGLAWYENENGDGSVWTERTVLHTPGFAGVAAADVDGDGDMDLLAASLGGNAIEWHQNLGAPESVAGWERKLVAGVVPGAAAVAAADVDGDGDQDVIAAASDADEVLWFENDLPVWARHVVSTQETRASSVGAADVDGDGDLDLVSSAAGGDIRWFENDGQSSFTPHLVSAQRQSPRSATTADLDCDGKLDVLSASSGDDTIAWHQQTVPAGTWSEHLVSTSARGASAVVGADLDGDGDLDVVSASRTDDTIAWYENAGVALSDSERAFLHATREGLGRIRGKIGGLP